MTGWTDLADYIQSGLLAQRLRCAGFTEHTYDDLLAPRCCQILSNGSNLVRIRPLPREHRVSLML